jgi:hypothetical protein
MIATAEASGSKRNLNGPGVEGQQSKRTLDAKSGRSQAQQVSIPGSRTGSGGWRPGEPRGIRAFNYNEDDSTHLNQSYVERVLSLAQNNVPGGQI